MTLKQVPKIHEVIDRAHADHMRRHPDRETSHARYLEGVNPFKSV
jgi:hypothetical protein